MRARSRSRSRPSSDDNDLPTNVSDETQLHNLPKECLASFRSDSCDNDDDDDDDDDDGDDDGDDGVNEKAMMMASRPLRYVDDSGNDICYSLTPMRYSVIFILLVELLERFSYCGIVYTQTLFLTGAYNKEWNAGFDSVQAASFVSASSMISYTTPFIGAYLSDSWLGDYQTLLLGWFCFYIPGVFLIVLTTIPRLLGDEFNQNLLTIAFFFLWPLGTGIVKSIVNGEYPSTSTQVPVPVPVPVPLRTVLESYSIISIVIVIVIVIVIYIISTMNGVATIKYIYVLFTLTHSLFESNALY